MNLRFLCVVMMCGLNTAARAADESDPVPHFKVESFTQETQKVDQLVVPAIVKANPQWDWIQLSSGEWLKGAFRGMERDEVDFDSDKLGLLTLDWEDITSIYSHRPMSIMLSDGSTLVGIMRSEGNKVVMIGPDQKLDLDEIIAVAVGVPAELERWTGNVAIGLSLRGGNVDQNDLNISSRFTRRTAHSSVRLSYTANYTEVEEVETANNQLANATYDYRLNKDWFLRPVGLEYYSDTFQNVESQWKFAVGAGYYIIDKKGLLWTAAFGPGYQKTRYDTVPAGEDRVSDSATLQLNMEYDQDLTKDIELYWLYEFTASNKETGKGKHHSEISLDIDLISDLDLRIAFYYDHTVDPQPDDNGEVPDSSDYRLTLGLNYDL